MKVFFVFFILCLFTGCQSTPVKTLNSLPYSEQEIWTAEKGYIQKLAEFQKDYTDYDYKYKYDIADKNFILTTQKSSLDYEIETQKIKLERKDEFWYVKNNHLKRGTLSYTWIEENGETVIEGTFSNETDVYPIAFDVNTLMITDHEEGSETYGQPMKFMKRLEERIVHEMIKNHNQLSLQKQLLSYWKTLADTVTSETDLSTLPDVSELVMDTSKQLESSYKREDILTYALCPRVVSINENFFIPFWNQATEFEKTLFIAAHIASEFSSAEEIDWTEVLVPVLGISQESGFVDGLECILHGKTIYLDYNHQNGYFKVGHLDDINETVYQLSGIQNAYLPQEDQSLMDDALYDADLNAYIVAAPDGEFVNWDPGIIILNQYSSGNLITVEFVVYHTEVKDKSNVVNGLIFGEVSDFSNEDDRMQAAYNTVKENIDTFDHWKLVVEKQKEGRLYKLISMHKTN